jgi:Zn-finger nucleic acid-binding protein
MKIVIGCIVLFVVYIFYIRYKIRKTIYHDPPNGTQFIHAEDFYDDEFSIEQIDYTKAKKRTGLLNELISEE